MKKSLLLLAISALLCVGATPTQAASDYSKCPDTWKLTTNDDSVLEKELADAKAVLGTNIAISITSREIQESGIWKVYWTDKFNSRDAYWLSLLQYPMRDNFKIEVKGCPTALNISRPGGLGNVNVVQSSYASFYDDILKAFPNPSPGDLAYRIKSFNFKQLEDSINLLKETVQNRVKDVKNGASNTLRGTFKYNDGNTVRTSALLGLLPVSDQITAGIFGSFELLPENLSCVVLNIDIAGEKPNLPFKLLPANKTCNYQLVAYIPTIKTIFKIDSVRIVTMTTEITCIKGKTSKKITGRNPTCPKGYTQK